MWQTYSSILSNIQYTYMYIHTFLHILTLELTLYLLTFYLAFHPGRTNQEDAQSWKEYMKTIGDPAD